MANLQVPLGTTSTPIDKDVEIDVEMWSRVPLPNTVPPSFETCNLSRYYELDISVGLVYGTKGNMKVNSSFHDSKRAKTNYGSLN